MEYSHYDEVPAHLQTKIIAAAKAERAGVRWRKSEKLQFTIYK
jgi:hypothetical protein